MAFPPYTPDHLNSSLVAVEFTSKAEIERVFSYKGVLLHLDDLDITDDNYIQGTDPDATKENFLTEVIQRVTSKVMEYLAHRFSPEVLEQQPRIREIATYWACHDISRRRGNEPIFENEYIEAIDTLERYQEGSLYLNAPSSGPRASVQAYVTDSRFYRDPVRVLSTSSSHKVDNQYLAITFPFFWL